MSFKDLLTLAKLGDCESMETLLEIYRPLMLKEAIIDLQLERLSAKLEKPIFILSLKIKQLSLENAKYGMVSVCFKGQSSRLSTIRHGEI